MRVQGLTSDSRELNWPLATPAVKAPIKIAKPARFGWKDKTLSDRAVGGAWGIPKNRVKIDNRAWNRTLNPLLEGFRSRLRLPAGSRLKTYLHDLLVYESGQFFRPHQLCEKVEGMVTTFVVVLPSL